MRRVAAVLALLGSLLVIEPFIQGERILLKLEDEGKVSATEFVLRFLGEIRYTLAAYLWLSAEIYHHELGLTEFSKNVGVDDPKKAGEIIGLCRLVTWLDPRFVQAYDVGAWRLGKGLGKFELAFNFLLEGIRNNPQDPLLHEDMATFYWLFQRDCRKAVPWLRKTVKLSRDTLQKANSLRIMGTCFERLRQPEMALEAYRDLLDLLPGDAAAARKIRQLRQLHGR